MRFHLPNGTREQAHLDMFVFAVFLSDAADDSTRTHRRCTPNQDPTITIGGSWLYCISVSYSFLGGVGTLMRK